MSDEYTPTTEAVRAKYARGTRSDGTPAQFVKWQKEFDSWLADHDAEVLAAAGFRRPAQTEPTDAQVDAALNSYWGGNATEYGSREEMRAALKAAPIAGQEDKP